MQKILAIPFVFAISTGLLANPYTSKSTNEIINFGSKKIINELKSGNLVVDSNFKVKITGNETVDLKPAIEKSVHACKNIIEKDDIKKCINGKITHIAPEAETLLNECAASQFRVMTVAKIDEYRLNNFVIKNLTNSQKEAFSKQFPDFDSQKQSTYGDLILYFQHIKDLSK